MFIYRLFISLLLSCILSSCGDAKRFKEKNNFDNQSVEVIEKFIGFSFPEGTKVKNACFSGGKDVNFYLNFSLNDDGRIKFLEKINSEYTKANDLSSVNKRDVSSWWNTDNLIDAYQKNNGFAIIMIQQINLDKKYDIFWFFDSMTHKFPKDIFDLFD